MPPTNDVSHGDILLQIGQLQGQVATLITLVGQKREDLNQAFTRLGSLEKTAVERPALIAVETRIGILERDVAKWCGFALACSVAIPILVTAAKPILHFGSPAQAAEMPRAAR